jgi:hypothetical protein
MQVIKILAVLVVLGAAGVLGYGYFGDMAPPQREITIELPPPGGGG